MTRPTLHDVDVVLDAARDLVLAAGPRSAGIRAISERSGAPSGSLYHRFGSRDALLAATWVRAVRRFQQGFVVALGSGENEMDAVGRAAAWTVEYAVLHPSDARLLLTHSARSLLDAHPDGDIAGELREVNSQLGPTLESLTARLYGRVSPQGLERVLQAVVDLPCAVVRRHLTTGELDPGLAATVSASAAAIVRVGLLGGGGS